MTCDECSMSRMGRIYTGARRHHLLLLRMRHFSINESICDLFKISSGKQSTLSPPNPIKASTRHGAPDSLDFKSICLQMNAEVRGWRAWLAAYLASLPVTWAVDTYELQHQSPSHHLINSFTFTQQSRSHFKPLWLIWCRCFMSILEWKVIYNTHR